MFSGSGLRFEVKGFGLSLFRSKISGVMSPQTF